MCLCMMKMNVMTLHQHVLWSQTFYALQVLAVCSCCSPVKHSFARTLMIVDFQSSHSMRDCDWAAVALVLGCAPLFLLSVHWSDPPAGHSSAVEGFQWSGKAPVLSLSFHSSPFPFVFFQWFQLSASPAPLACVPNRPANARCCAVRGCHKEGWSPASRGKVE